MKNKNQKAITFLLVVLFSCSAWGAVENVFIEGMIISYDKKTVTLLQRGRKIKVPRQSISRNIKLKTGKIVQAKIDSEKLMNDIIKLKKEQKKNQEDKKTKKAKKRK